MKRILVMKDGQNLTVKKDDGKYWVCDNGSQYAKWNPEILEVKEIKETAKKEEKKED